VSFGATFAGYFTVKISPDEALGKYRNPVRLSGTTLDIPYSVQTSDYNV
jgi:hypothetical protein